MSESKREYKGRGPNDENPYRGIDTYDLRPTVLKRETPSSFTTFSQPEVFRSLSSDPSELEPAPTALYRSSTYDSSLSKPDYRAVIDSSYSDILPPTKLISSKASPFSTTTSQFTSTSKYDFQSSTSKYDFQSSVLPKDLPKEPPPVPGGYLEPSYHFVSRAKPATLLDAIPKALISLLNKKMVAYGIDLDVIPLKYKVKCVAYPHGEPKLPFICRVFYLEPDDKGKRYALEFQRRSGCVMQFSDLWAKCKRFFQEAGLLVTTEKSLPSKLPMKPLDVEVTETQTRETMKCLLQMATSQCCDVKAQAVAALCKMSMEEQHQIVMIEEEGCLEAFIAAAGCPDEDVHRCAISALANLAHNRAGVCKKIAEKNGVQRLCTLSTSNTKEIVRESLRALLSLTQSLGCRILDDGCQRVMETHRNSHDPYTQQAIQYLTKLTV